MVKVNAWRGLALLSAAVALSGCLNGADAGLFASRGGGTSAQADPQVRVMSKSFVIAGPRGYCIDTGTTRDTGDSAFALLGSCAVVSGNPRDAKPKYPAMLTASVTPAATPLDAAALDRMAAFFSTDAGRGTLARADGAGEVSVIDLAREEGLLLVHAKDGERAGEVTGDYWRGIFETAGKLVTVTVSGFRANPLDEKSGAGLIRAFVSAIRKANTASTGETANAGAKAPVAAIGAAADRLTSFFNRLP